MYRTIFQFIFFSSFKASKIIINEIEKIQRAFLWGGVEESNRISLVSWLKVCMPKNNGVLGGKNNERFNLGLLSKWSWKFLNDHNDVWFTFLSYR